MKELASYDRNA